MHGARLEIDLDAIAENWRRLCRRHGAPVAGVVKANGYGLGAAQIASRLAREGCGCFFVAHLEEGIELRLRGAVPRHCAIGVLNGLLTEEIAAYRQHALWPVLGSLHEARAWSAAAQAAQEAWPAILHVDTGMNRLGLAGEEVLALHNDPRRLDGIDLRYIMTHLVSAEHPEDPVNALQAARFAQACAAFAGVPRSFANSSGIFLGPAFKSDLARPGAALYGINPTPAEPNPMLRTIRLQARVLQVRTIQAGESVGYNAIWHAARESRIATVCVGYADGWLRSLSSHGAADFDGIRLPLVGRVSMDLVTYDATNAPHLQTGAWVDLIGPHCPPDDLAVDAATNTYEILTSLGQRYQRIYLGA